MNFQHTPEPWFVDTDWFNRDEDKDEYGTIIGDDWCIALIYDDMTNSEANARRIVACVNACEGIPTERLEEENDLMGIFGRMRDERAENERLRALVAQMREMLEP